MFNINVGKINCELCGADCTPPNHLLGGRLTINPNTNPRLAGEIKKIDDEFGKHDFFVCYRCAARIMGAKPKVKPESEEKKEPVRSKQDGDDSKNVKQKT